MQQLQGQNLTHITRNWIQENWITFISLEAVKNVSAQLFITFRLQLYIASFYFEILHNT